MGLGHRRHEIATKVSFYVGIDACSLDCYYVYLCEKHCNRCGGVQLIALEETMMLRRKLIRAGVGTIVALIGALLAWIGVPRLLKIRDFITQ